jgi:molybdate transport system substrate-binding protein
VQPNGSAPDLSSSDSFKASLLKARSVAYVSPAAGGTSGTYFEGLLKRMGIYDQVKSKIVYRNQGSEVADAVAKGDAEIGISFIAELAPNKGVKIAGPLPEAIQSPTDYVAGVTAVSASPDAARAFIRAMTAASGGAVFKAAGLTVLPAGH